MQLLQLTLVPALAAATATATPANTAPEQIHIALAGKDGDGDATGFSFMWYTADAATAAPSVQYMLGGSVATVTATGASRQYLDGHGWHHAARATGIPPETRVNYRVGSNADGWSQNFTATTPPARDTVRTVKFSVFGDMGYEDSTLRPMAVATGGLVKEWSASYSRQTMEALKDSGQIEGVFHLGDIGYADDAFGHDPLHFEYENAYNGYMNWLQNISTVMPYMVVPGNHESECHSPACLAEEANAKQLSNFSAYNTRWAMPSAESGGSGSRHGIGGATNMWYSFSYGPIHFVGSNTETDFKGAGEEKTGDSHIPWLPAGSFGEDGEYLAWLESDLKAASESRANGTGRPWLVAGGHRPYGDLPQEAHDMYVKYGVDMYLAGHGHSYLRSVPASATAIERHHDPKHIKAAQAPVWVMVGGAGCEEMAQGVDVAPGQAAPVGSEAVASKRYATGVLEANQTTLYWRVIDSVNGTLIDEVFLTR